MKTRNQPPPRSAGLTIIELLAVITTTALLAVIFLLPANARNGCGSHRAACANNQRQLALAWWLHAEDNSGNIVGFTDSQLTDWRVRPFGSGPWTTPPGAPPASARDAVILWDGWGYQLGGLYRYAPHANILHCPADPRINKSAPAYTSYSGAGGVNGSAWGFELTNTSQFEHPVERFLWAEEGGPQTTALNGYTIGENLSSWAQKCTSVPRPPDPSLGPDYGVRQWFDSPGVFHANTTVFSYADGHVESRRWEGRETLELAADPVLYRGPAHAEDLLFMASRYASTLNP